MVRRNTNQRKIVFDCLEKLGHATSENLINYIKDNYENISLATIYRNLNILEQEEFIKKISLDGVDIYETVKCDHFHFVCTKCGFIYDISPEELNCNVTDIKNISGNTVTGFDLAFYGECKKCKGIC